MNRLYVSRKRDYTYRSINAACKLCSIVYSIIIKRKPEPNSTYVFEVEADVHDVEKHNNKKLQMKAGERIYLAESIFIET